MAANSASPRVRSEVRIPQRDGMTLNVRKTQEKGGVELC